MQQNFNRAVSMSVVYENDPDGSQPKKKLIFSPNLLTTAHNLSASIDLSYEGDKTKFINKFLIKPQNHLKILWDFLILTIIVLQGVYIPLLLSFELDISTAFIFFDLSTTCCLLIDIILSFNTGYLKKGAIIMNRSEITRNYLKTWFFLDIFSSFPYDWLINQNPFDVENYKPAGKNFTKATKLIRITRLSRILSITKLLKLAKAKMYLYRLEDYLNSELMGRLLTATKLCLVIFYIAHWNACVWYFFTKYFIDGETWLNINTFVEYSEREAYVYSLYWSMYTMSSVGYGDVKIGTTQERVLAIFSMVIMCALFGFLIGEISSVIQKESLKYETFRDLKKNINSLMSDYSIPTELRHRTRKYVDYSYEKYCNYMQENDIINSLSLPLREEISHIINWPVFKHCKLFQKLFHSNIVESLSYLFTQQTFSPFDNIVKQDERERKMYFLTHGTIEFYLNSCKRRLMVLKDQGYFGEIGFFADSPRVASAMSVGFSDALILDYDLTWKLMEKFPDQQKILLEIEEQCKSDLCILEIRCCFCNKIGHTALHCFERTLNEAKKRVIKNWILLKNEKRKKVFKFGYMDGKGHGMSSDIVRNRKRKGVFQRKNKVDLKALEAFRRESMEVEVAKGRVNFDDFLESEASLNERQEFLTYGGKKSESEGEDTGLIIRT